MKNKQFKLSADTAVSASAIIIAAASIFVAVWQGMEIRKHNRLSVKPRLQIIFNTDKHMFGYIVVNNGLGPAVITGKRIFVDAEEIGYEGFSGYEDFIRKLGLQGREMVQGAVNPGMSILAGDTRNIILFAYDEDDTLETLLPEIYQRIGIEITYESMYHETDRCVLPADE